MGPRLRHALRIALMGSFIGHTPALASAPASPPQRRVVERERTFRMPSDVKGIDLLVHCDRDIPALGYSAETDSGVPLDSPYARERGVDKGLVRLMMDSQRRALAFHVPAERIRSVVEIRYDMDVYDKMDLLLTTDGGLLVVHTAATNAGIFTVSDVWRLPAAVGLSSLSQPMRRFAQRALRRCGLSDRPAR